ncbi:MAG: hypothetical protein VX642_06945 [Bdellovibrionota bacterium]|nr:hypothetical protein [Bdellovibrionota bacterium]
MSANNNSHKGSHELTGSNKAAKIGAIIMLIMFAAIVISEIYKN